MAATTSTVSGTWCFLTTHPSHVLAAADVESFTYTTTCSVLLSLRLDNGAGSQVHP